MNFLSNDDCLRYLALIRWDGIVISPFSPTSKVYHCPHHKYKCQSTGKYFNAKTGTIFANTRISLITWFKAIEIILTERNLTSSELAKKIEVSQKTAWHIQNKVRQQKIYLIPKNSEEDMGKDAEKLNLLDWLILHKDNG